MFAHCLGQPTRTASLTSLPRRYRLREPSASAVPIRSCSRWGLPCRRRCRRRGALLPHRFTLTAVVTQLNRGGLFSVALSLGSRPPDVIRHRLSMEPGLSSPACAGAAVRPTDGNRDGGLGPCRQVSRRQDATTSGSKLMTRAA